MKIKIFRVLDNYHPIITIHHETIHPKIKL